MTQYDFDLTGKVALVTGGSSGLGQQQALALAAAGARVVVAGRRMDKLESTVKSIAGLDSTAIAISVDLNNRTGIPDFANQALKAFGRLDILINAAGVNLRQDVNDISIESWDQTLNLNLATPFFLARECVKDMQRRNWGRVINIASLQSTRAFANGLAYGASKGGVSQLTRAMAETWSASGINCNAIAPGFFPTELTAPVFENVESSSKFAAQTAIGRNGKLSDLDGLTVFLASTASEYITGQIIAIDGGFTAK